MFESTYWEAIYDKGMLSIGPVLPNTTIALLSQLLFSPRQKIESLLKLHLSQLSDLSG